MRIGILCEVRPPPLAPLTQPHTHTHACTHAGSRSPAPALSQSTSPTTPLHPPRQPRLPRLPRLPLPDPARPSSTRSRSPRPVSAGSGPQSMDRSTCDARSIVRSVVATVTREGSSPCARARGPAYIAMRWCWSASCRQRSAGRGGVCVCTIYSVRRLLLLFLSFYSGRNADHLACCVLHRKQRQGASRSRRSCWSCCPWSSRRSASSKSARRSTCSPSGRV